MGPVLLEKRTQVMIDTGSLLIFALRAVRNDLLNAGMVPREVWR